MFRQTAPQSCRFRPGFKAGARSRSGFAAAFGAAAFLLIGCAHPFAEVLRPIPPGPSIPHPNPALARVVLPRGTAKGDCGPEALCAVMAYWGDDCPVTTVSRALYNPSLQGTVSMDLVPFARKRGFEAEFSEGTLESLARDCAEGRPVVVMVDIALLPYAHEKSSPVAGWYHFFPVVGVNPETREVLCAHYEGGRLAIRADAFDAAWKACGRFAVTLKPTEKLARRLAAKKKSAAGEAAAVPTAFEKEQAPAGAPER